jgi:Leucine-rich repeat (LRR) protein
MEEETSITDRVNRAIELKSGVIDLSYLHLRKLPLEVFSIQELKVLYLRKNRLILLPQEICNLADLKTLDIANNILYALPLGFGELTQLITLNLTSNKLSRIPNEIGNLTNLQSLFLGQVCNSIELITFLEYIE